MVQITGGRSAPTPVTAPAVSTSPAYTSGDALGIAFKISNVFRSEAPSGLLQSIVVVDASFQGQPIDFFFFSAQPTSGVDNSPYTLAAADYAKLLGVQSLFNYVTTSSGASVGELDNIALPLEAGNGADIWVQMVTRGGPTYATTTALSLMMGFLQD